MRKKILIFHPALAPYRVDFFNSLSRQFDATYYFENKNVPDQEFDQEILLEQCEFSCNYLKSGIKIKGRTFITGVFSKIRNHNPDVILTSEFGIVSFLTFVYVKLFQRKVKLYTLSDDSLANAKERKGIRKLLRDQITKNSNGVIFPSEEVCDWYNENISHKTICLELPIIHDEKVLRIKYSQSLAKANENIKRYDLQGKIVILYVGRLVEVKNLVFLLKCFAKIENDNCRLVIVGDGELRSVLEESLISLELDKKVIMTGRKEGLELYSWYTFAQIFVFPSTYERFGAVVNEALLGGCFTLCSKAAGANTLINDKNGLVFDPENESKFIEILEIAINNAEKLDSKVISLRDNLMPFSFDEKINLLIQEL